MMTITKAGGATASPSPKAEDHTECCMCGDLGLSSELFRCKICHFRSQHRYCSNIYPRAESYRACNWCLSEKEGSPEKTQNSFNSSSSNKSTGDRDDLAVKNKKKIYGSNNNNVNVKGLSLKVSVNNRSIKKQKSSPSPESQRSPMLAARKRITTVAGGGAGSGGGMKKENLRRTKSDIPKSVVHKHGFRNKVRRYKLLDEVSA